ncbi:MAG: 1-deoxy-D-xylulose-5-phosphate synthase [Oscillospiraceae bacterium]|jgi:1-deoxy-D-xylulose-5-phosphate synthase|nr:1-deoxy-D-xylulose-5-phosphate synthase [Oscillospiraceae bacterium]
MSEPNIRILDTIASPDDLRRLDFSQLNILCGELRDEIITACAHSGGHLASNLGVVELTVALHRLFDFSSDRLVFDVGHQCYAHKMLTGRRGEFDSLRKFGGLSGFPKPSESVYDAFPVGHASTSVSAALGLARARTLLGQTHSVVALLGDGALTGGLAYEGLCDAGDSGEPLIVILNDNGMSITENVGGVARYLQRRRMHPSYLEFKRRYRKASTKRLLRGLYKLTHRVKSAVKRLLLGITMFEDMGFEYIGPVDGHDLAAITRALEWVKSLNKPVLLHISTHKGLGYTPAESAPELYHGVSPFDVSDGVCDSGGDTFSGVFGDTLTELAEREPRVVAITAAMTSGTGLSGFAERFRERFFDVGIAESHAVTLSAALSVGGAIPVFAVYSTFFQRGYDQLLHDVALSGAHCVFAVDRAGLVPGDGETHQGVYDVGFLASVPNMTVFAPASFAELRDMLHAAILDCAGAVAVRYPKGSEGTYRDGGAEPSKIIRTGRDFTVVTYGAMTNVALDAAKLLETQGIDIEIVKLGRVSPIDFTDIRASVTKKTGKLLVLEDSAAAGSVGERILAEFGREGVSPASPAILLNTGSRVLPCGTVAELRTLCGLDAESVAARISGALRG